MTQSTEQDGSFGELRGDVMPDGLPRPNLPLLRKVLDHIDAHPDEWDQEHYGVQSEDSACGTAFCIAGHAVVMSGYTFTDAEQFRDPQSNRLIDAQTVAQSLLGLTDDEASDYAGGLFAPGNDRGDIQMLADRITARAGERL